MEVFLLIRENNLISCGYILKVKPTKHQNMNMLIAGVIIIFLGLLLPSIALYNFINKRD